MLFRIRPINRITRILAILVLMSFGVPLFLFSILPLFLIGCLLELTGFAAIIVQLFQMWRERPDPYDLHRLKLVMEQEDARQDELDEEEADRYDRNLVVCHRCGASMADFHSICPSCGTPLGH
jgi:hypothetical protein